MHLRLALRVRNRITFPMAGFCLPDHDPPLPLIFSQP